MGCPCAPAAEQPWRTRDSVFSPASIVGGLCLVAFGIVALVAGLHPWVGAVVFGVLGALIAGALVLELRRGHRGWCLVRRAVWFGVAVPGVPLRVLATLP